MKNKVPTKSLVFLSLLFTTLSSTLLANEYRFLTGNEADVKPVLHGPVINLDGGGILSEGSLQAMINSVRGCDDCTAKVDVVALDWMPSEASPSDLFAGFNPIFKYLDGVDSVESIFLTGNNPVSEEIGRAIANAEVIFIEGGDQCEYTTHFRGVVQSAIKQVYNRGGAIGGTSAGMAIQSDIVFDGCKLTNVAMDSAAGLKDPYDEKISFEHGFFNWKYLENTITDTHFANRDRFGRTAAFLARHIKDGKARIAHAIAADEATSVLVDVNGLATVYGEGNVYFITADKAPKICERGKPLSISGLKVWKVRHGEKFNLKTRSKRTGHYTVSVTEGKLSRDPY